MMFELKYDILDDLEPIESRTKQRLIDEIDKESVFPEQDPVSWYRDVYEFGCNLMFTMDVPIRFEHTLGDKTELIETLDLLLERYFGAHPRIQAVYVGVSENVRQYLDTSVIPIESQFVSRRFLHDILPSEYPDNRLIFKMPVKLNVESVSRAMFRILNFLAAMWSLRNKFGLKYSMCFCRLSHIYGGHEFITCREPYEIKYKKEFFSTGWIRTLMSMIYHITPQEKQNEAEGACVAWIKKYSNRV